MRRGRDISKAGSEARDSRMKLLNELVSEAKFIKFGAGEDRTYLPPTVTHVNLLQGGLINV
jgi:hypothetical protein